MGGSALVRVSCSPVRRAIRAGAPPVPPLLCRIALPCFGLTRIRTSFGSDCIVVPLLTARRSFISAVPSRVESQRLTVVRDCIAQARLLRLWGIDPGVLITPRGRASARFASRAGRRPVSLAADLAVQYARGYAELVGDPVLGSARRVQLDHLGDLLHGQPIRGHDELRSLRRHVFVEVQARGAAHADDAGKGYLIRELECLAANDVCVVRATGYEKLIDGLGFVY